MKGVLLLGGWMLVGGGAQAADVIEPLDADFLDYLASMEGDDDNWTLLDVADRKSAGNEAVREPANKPATGKATKEAAKPAVEER